MHCPRVSSCLIIQPYHRCIELDEEEEEDEDGDSNSDCSEASSSSDVAPFPSPSAAAAAAAPRNSTAIFEPGHPGSAFTSYVRKRGEPDGRQAHDSPPLSGSSASSFPQVSNIL